MKSRSRSIYASEWNYIRVYIKMMKILTLKTELQNRVQNGLDYTSTTSGFPYVPEKIWCSTLEWRLNILCKVWTKDKTLTQQQQQPSHVTFVEVCWFRMIYVVMKCLDWWSWAIYNFISCYLHQKETTLE